MRVDDLIDDPYKEEKYKEVKEVPLSRKMRNIYGTPHKEVVASWEPVANTMFKAYTLLKDAKTANKAWDIFNTEYYMENKRTMLCLVGLIVYNLHSGYKQHKYFKHRIPDEDDVQDVIVRVLTRIKAGEWEDPGRGFPNIIVKTVVWEIRKHLRDKHRQEHRGGVEHAPELPSWDSLEFEQQATDEGDESTIQYSYDTVQHSTETPYDAYEKAQMAAW